MEIRYLMTSSEMTQKIGNIVEYNDMYTLILTWQHSSFQRSCIQILILPSLFDKVWPTAII